MGEKEKQSSLAVRWLEPGEVSARWDPASARLTVTISGEEELGDARAALAFPVSHPGEFIDLCNDKNESAGMLRSLKGLEGETRKALEAALEVRYLIPRVERVLDLQEASPFVLRWQVATDRGERVFTTESPREAVRYQSADRIRVTDLAGNHYDFPTLKGLDAASRAILEAYL